MTPSFFIKQTILRDRRRCVLEARASILLYMLERKET